MKTLLRALRCLLGRHCLPPGVNREESFYFNCDRCRAFVPGDMGIRRKW